MTLSRLKPAFPVAKYVSHWLVHFIMLSAYAWYTGAYLMNLPDLSHILFQGIAAHYLIDFISAIFHFGLEIYVQDDWHLKACQTITEGHHTDVLNYSDFSLSEKLAFSYAFQAPFFIVLTLIPTDSILYGLGIWTMAYAFSIASVHDWAHRRAHKFKIPPGVRSLQNWGLIMSGQHHNKHHFENPNAYYGFFSGNTDWLTNLFLRKPQLPKYQEVLTVERRREIGRLIALRTARQKQIDMIPAQLSGPERQRDLDAIDSWFMTQSHGPTK